MADVSKKTSQLKIRTNPTQNILTFTEGIGSLNQNIRPPPPGVGLDSGNLGGVKLFYPPGSQTFPFRCIELLTWKVPVGEKCVKMWKSCVIVILYMLINLLGLGFVSPRVLPLSKPMVRMICIEESIDKGDIQLSA